MSMTQEEAIEIFEQKGWWIAQKETLTSKQAEEIIKLNNAVNFTLSALRPVSLEKADDDDPASQRLVNMAKNVVRSHTLERIEEAWRGEWILDEDDGKYQCDNCKIKFPVNYNFCPYCGSAKTEKAMQKVIGKLESLEEMKNG